MFQYNVMDNKWETLHPFMSEARNGHSCIVIDKVVLVTGGYGKKSSEIFSLSEQRWRTGPDLPTTNGYAKMVQAQPGSKYSAYLIGGLVSSYNPTSAIYGLTKDMTKFVKLGDLKIARSGHVALSLPENVIGQCPD